MEEMLDHVRRQPVSTLSELRKSGFTLRLVSLAARHGHIVVEELGDRVQIRLFEQGS